MKIPLTVIVTVTFGASLLVAPGEPRQAASPDSVRSTKSQNPELVSAATGAETLPLPREVSLFCQIETGAAETLPFTISCDANLVSPIETAAAETLPLPRELETLPQPREIFFRAATPSREKEPAPDAIWRQRTAAATEALRSLERVAEARYDLDWPALADLGDHSMDGKRMGRVSERIANSAACRGLPWRHDRDGYLGHEPALAAAEMAKEIRIVFSEANESAKKTLDAEQRYQKVWSRVQQDLDKWRRPHAARLWMQILQAEEAVHRRLLVDVLAAIGTADAVEALAKLAVFDTDERIRGLAVASLAKRPAARALPVLVAGLRHVWPPIAAQAAEAAIALRIPGTAPELARLVDAPDPSVPFRSTEHGDQPVIRELVRMNHNLSCIVCHRVVVDMKLAPSPRLAFTGAVPSLDDVLPDDPTVPSQYPYNNRSESDSLLIRFDRTYLRQEFSAKMPCNEFRNWPKQQRFDFVTRVRPATPDEILAAAKKGPAYPQRDAVLHALRTLTGKDGGDSKQEWQRILANAPRN
jgi:hypothetical protein